MGGDGGGELEGGWRGAGGGSIGARDYITCSQHLSITLSRGHPVQTKASNTNSLEQLYQLTTIKQVKRA